LVFDGALLLADVHHPRLRLLVSFDHPVVNSGESNQIAALKSYVRDTDIHFNRAIAKYRDISKQLMFQNKSYLEITDQKSVSTCVTRFLWPIASIEIHEHNSSWR
jgi:hypothetical protein